MVVVEEVVVDDFVVADGVEVFELVEVVEVDVVDLVEVAEVFDVELEVVDVVVAGVDVVDIVEEVLDVVGVVVVLSLQVQAERTKTAITSKAVINSDIFLFIRLLHECQISKEYVNIL